MTTRIEVRERAEDVTEPRVGADGIWRAMSTGRTRTVYDVLIDNERYAICPTRESAMHEAESRAFVADLVAGDHAAAGALALYLSCTPEED